ncbi:hypothetical protein [Segniliparus rugosus]|uniref:Uncharacterized protein n=1 Tax=Segniliparus rugosus (strain ATCC BAA-974 / DSM 45345 / CCUG 50838 / CIP 108380 / JCM 13579 / CDC 945) TaxID=679197 RepID=E5XM20_SEGRC|nr:hypothetical protein [Segniliparus rugosus]EFV14626.2 hypothetical protein HMPREF9336_00539 [Segniliparus rugosus ATCC BAA-974]
MRDRENKTPSDSERTEGRSRFTVARALLLGALSFGSLVGGEAAA